MAGRLPSSLAVESLFSLVVHTCVDARARSCVLVTRVGRILSRVLTLKQQFFTMEGLRVLLKTDLWRIACFLYVDVVHTVCTTCVIGTWRASLRSRVCVLQSPIVTR